ncbi:hypothetical protein WJX79_008846 [Trebouxia sp. C0005]
MSADKLAFIRQHCPIVVFHESEQFFPCSVSHLLKDSTLIQRRRDDPTGAHEFHVGDATLEELASYCNSDQQEHFVEISPTQYAGHTPNEGLIHAPVYVAIVEVEESFVDVYYIFLYAYQGSQTFRCTPPIAKHFNCIAHEYGRHQGDVEHFIVRTDTSFSKVLSVAYEAHGEQAWYFPGDYPLQDGHPLVYASLLNHAHYFLAQPTRVPTYTEEIGRPVRQAWFITHQAHQCVEAIDIIHQSPKSAVWKPFTTEENLVLVSANNPASQWVRYNGQFGKCLGKPAFTHATEVWGAPFGIGRRAIVSTIAAGAAKMREFGHGAPTSALGARHYIQRPKIADWKHIHVFAAQDVVLSANPADLSGPLIMARMKPGDPYQMWYQDFWNQFGCSTSTWSIGPLGETCHTKSQAFVLINKATMQLVWAGEQGQPLTLADYAMGKDADLTRRCTLFDQGTDEQQVAGDDFRAIRPTYNHKLNWTAGHSTFELSLSDADTSPCEVLASAWEQADEQKWKIVPASYQPPALAKNTVERQRLFSIRVRRRDSRFGLSLEEGRLVLRLVLPGSPEQSWKVEQTGFGSSVKIINADTRTALRSCGMDEAVRDTVLADTSPSARWNLVACEGNWVACSPSSDDTENLNAWGGDIHDGCEVHTFAWKGKHDRHNMMWGFFPLDDPLEAVNPCL